MEKFFIATEKSNFYKDYFAYNDNRKQLRKLMCGFAKSNNLPNLASADENTYSIIVKKGESNPFENQLKKGGVWTKKGELHDFKKNSPIGKAWCIFLKTNGFKPVGRPYIFFYFTNISGRCGMETFYNDKTLYLKINTEQEPNTPNGMNEIKGSEYYKAIEDWEDKHNA